MEIITLTGRMNIQVGGGLVKMDTYAGAPGDVLEVPADVAAMARRMGYAEAAPEPETPEVDTAEPETPPEPEVQPEPETPETPPANPRPKRAARS